MDGGGNAGEPGGIVKRLAAALGRPAVQRPAQIVVGVLLGWAALAKLSDLPSFARDIHHFHLMPVAGENLLAIVLPWVELVAALALILNLRARGGALVAAALLGIFTAAVGVALARGLDITCGCFGTAGASRVGVLKLLENVAFLTLATIALLPPRRAAAPGGAPPSPA